MIPIKGYSTFHPLKHCWIGSGFKAEWFEKLFTDDKILSPLKRIAEETEEDFQILEKILKDAGVKTYRSLILDNPYKFNKKIDIPRPPVCPRDNFAVIGEKIYVTNINHQTPYKDLLLSIESKNVHLDLINSVPNFGLSTATICRVGKDLWWDTHYGVSNDVIEKYKKIWTDEGFRVHMSNRSYHSDSAFCVVKPGCIVSLYDVQSYDKEFPDWDVLYLPENQWDMIRPWWKIKDKVDGRWWIKGEEDNDQLIEFVNTWLNDWVGYVEETVFDINMLSIDENTIICNNYNKEVFDYFKKHKVEPVLFNFRHRFFWDGGVHCITQDLYREGTMENYFD